MDRRVIRGDRISQAFTARIAEALCKTCLDRAEETVACQKAAGPQTDSLQEIYTSSSAAKPRTSRRWNPSAVPAKGGPSAFQRRLVRFLATSNPIRPGASGRTTEVSSTETGLVFAKAGAPERWKAWRNSF